MTRRRQRGGRPRRAVVLSLAAAVVLIVVGWAAGAVSSSDAEAWATVERGDLVLGVEINGRLRATETSVLSPPQIREIWEYKISFMAPEGEEVEAGAPVLAFDDSELQRRLLVQQAEREEAAKQIEKTEQNLEMRRRRDALRLAEAQARRRKAGLKVERPGELSSARELAEARLELELAEKELAYLERRLAASQRSAVASLAALQAQKDNADRRAEELEEAIRRMRRNAPRPGTVIYVTNWRDEKKKVGDSCWRGESVIELPDLARMRGDGQVDEADAGQVAEGQRVTLRLDAHPDDAVSGSVASIWKSVQRESWRSPLKIVRLDVELDETDTRKMRPGMRFRGRVETERIENALLVPSDAIELTASGPVVRRRTWLGTEIVPVELGRRDDERVEVLTGLSEGDRVSLERRAERAT